MTERIFCGLERNFDQEQPASRSVEAKDDSGNSVELVGICRWCHPTDPQKLPKGKLYTNMICRVHLWAMSIKARMKREGRIPMDVPKSA